MPSLNCFILVFKYSWGGLMGILINSKLNLVFITLEGQHQKRGLKDILTFLNFKHLYSCFITYYITFSSPLPFQTCSAVCCSMRLISHRARGWASLSPQWRFAANQIFSTPPPQLDPFATQQKKRGVVSSYLRYWKRKGEGEEEKRKKLPVLELCKSTQVHIFQEFVAWCCYVARVASSV